MARGDGALARGAGSPHRAGAGRGGVRLLCFVFFPDLKSSQLGELREARTSLRTKWLRATRAKTSL